ncbi:MAG: 50S ribosomal protein L15 [Candidatus Levybacteria bacterium]|nr:50S ribosomal protein L15 [Candidatus Levybacteria bacterium]
MQIHTLPQTNEKALRRLGRGHGSGRGKTSGRGTKGRKAHGDVPATFEGGALPLIKRLPFLRGKDKNPVRKPNMVPVNVGDLAKLPPKTEVTAELLLKENIVGKEAKKRGVKILGKGEITIPLIVKLPVSKSAQTKIEQANGSIVAE